MLVPKLVPKLKALPTRLKANAVQLTDCGPLGEEVIRAIPFLFLASGPAKGGAEHLYEGCLSLICLRAGPSRSEALSKSVFKARPGVSNPPASLYRSLTELWPKPPPKYPAFGVAAGCVHCEGSERSTWDESALDRFLDPPCVRESAEVAYEGVAATEAGDLGGWKRCALRPATGVKMVVCCDEGGDDGRAIAGSLQCSSEGVRGITSAASNRAICPPASHAAIRPPASHVLLSHLHVKITSPVQASHATGSRSSSAGRFVDSSVVPASGSFDGRRTPTQRHRDSLTAARFRFRRH